MATPTCGQSRNSGSFSSSRKMKSVVSLKLCCSMSKLTNAPVRLASARDGPQPRRHAAEGAGRVDRVELAVQGAQLHRHVHPGQGAAVVPVDGRHLGPPVHLGGEAVQQVVVLPGHVVGLGLRDGRLAEQVDGEGVFVGPHPPHRRHRLRHVGAGDELAGHLGGVEPGGLGQQLAAEAAAGHQADAVPHPPRQLGVGPAEVLLQVPGDLRRVVHQVRQGVHEPEQLHLQGLVPHGEGHELVVQPAAGERQRAGAVEPGEQLPADLLGAGVRRVWHGGCPGVGRAGKMLGSPPGAAVMAIESIGKVQHPGHPGGGCPQQHSTCPPGRRRPGLRPEAGEHRPTRRKRSTGSRPSTSSGSANCSATRTWLRSTAWNTKRPGWVR